MSAGRLAVVGAGRVGLSLAADLADAGLFSSVTVVGRRSTPPSFLSDLSDAPAAPSIAYRTATVPAREVPDVLILCVPDDRLDGVAATWAEADGGAVGRVALHTSGIHPASRLEALLARGWRVGGWHPLVAIAAPRRGAFRGVTVGLEGQPEAVAVGERMASALGARSLPLSAEVKDHYHAGAVFASNFLVACLAVALREISLAAGAKAGPEHLLPLARSALENVAARGLAGGATGPVVRGDAGTVARHLAALDARTGALYRALASELLRETGAEAANDARERLTRLLEGEGSQPAD